MKIAGIEKCSFVDYPGRLAAVFFTPGCNWDCYFCHNRLLLGNPEPSSWLTPETALSWLDERRGFLEAAVVSGGEPTLQKGLAEFIREVRARGFLVKLDTNGSHPEVLRELIEEGLPDYVAMDIKAPLGKYEAICGFAVDHRAINESIDLLLSGATDYEFRTTVVPQLTHADVHAIAKRIRGARRFVLQQYRRNAALASQDRPDPRLEFEPHSSAWLLPIYSEIEPLVQRCETRGFDLERPAAQSSAA